MDLKAKTTELFKLLELEYNEQGFKFNSNTGTFYTINSEVFWMIEYSFTDYIIYKPVLISKLKEIIEVLDKLFPSSPAIVTQISQGHNLAQEFGYPIDYLHLIDQNTGRDKGLSYKVTSTTNLDIIIEDHLQYMRKVGFKFLEDFASLNGVNTFINSKILEGNLDFFLSRERQQEIKKLINKREILSGLISAYLLDTSNKEEIIKRIRLKYKDKGPVIRDIHIIISYFESSVQIVS